MLKQKFLCHLQKQKQKPQQLKISSYKVIKIKQRLNQKEEELS